MSQNKNKSPNPVNQHWVPRFYLKHFAIPETREDNNPKVYAWNVDEDKIHIIGIEGVASSRYLYSPMNENGNRDFSTENKLASLESTLAGGWHILTDGMLDIYEYEELRKGIALFVSLLILRHPDNINKHKQIHKKAIEFYDSLPKDHDGNPDIEQIEIGGKVYSIDTTQYDKYRNANEYDFQKMFIDTINSSSIEIAEHLFKKRWSFIISKKPVFFTCDNPVLIENLKQCDFGISTPGTVVVFPISPSRLLLLDDMHDQPKGRYYPLKNDVASAYNSSLIKKATRFVVSHREIDFEKDIMHWIRRHDRNRRLFGPIPDFVSKIIFNIRRFLGRIDVYTNKRKFRK